ncbi:hypothetical protein [Streptomyces muensis]|uniref:Uncharacterized protein n=1 Tax=Streptomyces muensis TaxID=1077944 RepID=A0A9X1TJL9_STRM4|nr:hypothetical protein [Streptomyces muensis]MCF1592734.1 hypothetical protein [Streptomyces muensis]
MPTERAGVAYPGPLRTVTAVPAITAVPGLTAVLGFAAHFRLRAPG